MAKRIVIEFICDVCARIASVEAHSRNMTGNVAKVYPYPKGWHTSPENSSIDVCPDCPMPVVGTVTNTQEPCRGR